MRRRLRAEVGNIPCRGKLLQENITCQNMLLYRKYLAIKVSNLSYTLFGCQLSGWWTVGQQVVENVSSGEKWKTASDVYAICQSAHHAMQFSLARWEAHSSLRSWGTKHVKPVDQMNASACTPPVFFVRTPVWITCTLQHPKWLIGVLPFSLATFRFCDDHCIGWSTLDIPHDFLEPLPRCHSWLSHLCWQLLGAKQEICWSISCQVKQTPNRRSVGIGITGCQVWRHIRKLNGGITCHMLYAHLTTMGYKVLYQLVDVCSRDQS